MHKLLLSIAFIFSILPLRAADFDGSHTPYPVPQAITVQPDSLVPFYISHIGRHGSRFPSSASTAKYIKFYLDFADTTGTITPTGRQLLDVINATMEYCDGRWGDLDSLGISEQRGIAERLYAKYPEVLDSGIVEAIASRSPRSVMSMYAFTHRLTQLASKIEISTSEGDRYSPLLRPYDVNEKYLSFRSSQDWKAEYDKYYETVCPLSVARRLVGKQFEASDDALRELSLSVYSFLSGMTAMGLDIDHSPYCTDEEYELLWSIDNLHHYLLYSATTISTVPAELAIPLVEDIVEAADRVVEGRRPVAANLRFAHAETLMPLLSLLQIKGGYYLTHYFDQVKLNWQDYAIVPMAANLQFIFFKTDSGNIYVRTDLNEQPVPLIPGNPGIYLPWNEVRDYLLNFILAI